MEQLLPNNIKNYLKEHFLQNALEKFGKVLENKSFKPILLVSSNSILSNYFIEEILKMMFPTDQIIMGNHEQKLSSNKNATFNVKISKNHIEVNPSECGINDKNIVSEYIVDVSSTKNIVSGNKKNIVIWNVDAMGTISFESLLNTIRINQETANFICICKNIKKIDKSVYGVMIPIIIEDMEMDFVRDFCEKFYGEEEIDVKQFIIGLNNVDYLSFIKNVSFGELFNEKLQSTNILKSYIEKIYNLLTIKSKISDSYIEEIRALLYDLYVYQYNYDEIVEIFLFFVSNDSKINEKKKRLILDKACQFSLTSNSGNKQVLHLEAFIFAFLNIFWRKK